jgi:hypothetical protein
MAMGDHDFGPGDHSWQSLNDKGISQWKPGMDFLKEWLPKFKPTVLSTNVIDGNSGAPPAGTKPFDVTTLNGVKIGWFGLTTQTTSSIIPPEQLGNVKLTDPTVAARGAVDSLHQQGVNLIFGLSHLDDAENQALSIPRGLRTTSWAPSSKRLRTPWRKSSISRWEFSPVHSATTMLNQTRSIQSLRT